MSTWKVLKYEDWEDGEGAIRDYWREIGTHESAESYYLGYSPDIAQEIGERFGAGEYLFLSDEGQQYRRLTVGSRQEFYEVKPPEGIPEGSTLEAITDPRD